jgi:hypothetical protein
MAIIHEEFIKSYFEKNPNEVLIASDIYEILKKSFPITDENCRKVLSNCALRGYIRNSNPIYFGNKQYAYFSPNQKKEYKVLKECICEHKKYLHRVIFALERNGGILSMLEAIKISGATINKNSHSININTILNELDALGIAEVMEYQGTHYICMMKNGSPIPLDEQSLDNLKVKNTLLVLVLDWLKRCNLVDGAKLCFMGPGNYYNGIVRNTENWDAFGFSNAIGIGNIKKEYQTIVLMDFNYQYRYEEYDFIGFQERVNRTVFSVKNENRKVLPIVIVNDISSTALALIKKNQYLIFKISDILGVSFVNVANSFIRNIDTLNKKITEKEEGFASNICETLEEIKKSGNEDNYGNMKGTLFEYLMYPVINKIYSSGALINHSYERNYENQHFECDYLIETADENIIIELKGYKKGNIIRLGNFDVNTNLPERDTVKWFLQRTFELCKKCIGGNKEFKFCYITTADFEETAKTLMMERKKNRPKGVECFYNGTKLIELLNQYNMENEIKVINQYYMV